MQALHSPSNSTPTNVVPCSSPISTNPNPNAASPDSKSPPMADSSSSPTVAESDKENICPFTGLVANSVVSPKRSRFVRKPLADITNLFKQRNLSNEGLFESLGSIDGQKKMLKRKADSGYCDAGEVRMSCRSKTLRMSFR